jgi:3-phosphoshikimate 1-carboxyvinyltransferase
MSGATGAGVRSIQPIRRVEATLEAPSSKSATQRALIAASLAPGRSILRRPLLGDDGRHLLRALEALGVGARLEGVDRSAVLTLEGLPAAPPPAGLRLDVGDAGTAMRFLAGRGAAEPVAITIDGSPRMRQRPIEDLLQALRGLGAEAVSMAGNGCPPVRVGGRGLAGGEVRLAGGRSSQFLSAILLAAPAAAGGVAVEVDAGLVSRPYVDLTLAVMRAFGVEVRVAETSAGARRYAAGPGARYRPADLAIEGDWSSASYWFLAAAIVPGRVRVRGLDPVSMQGDARLLPLLEAMGCRVGWEDAAIEVEGGGPLRGIDADLRDLPDMAPTLAVAALFATGPTTITGVPHLRFKESDRIEALCAAIAALGGRATPRADGLRIEPEPLLGAPIDPRRDHRLAMAFAVAGLRLPGVSILDPGCVTKSYPAFWQAFDALGSESRT